jgi:hypothetical protein
VNSTVYIFFAGAHHNGAHLDRICIPRRYMQCSNILRRECHAMCSGDNAQAQCFTLVVFFPPICKAKCRSSNVVQFFFHVFFIFLSILTLGASYFCFFPS